MFTEILTGKSVTAEIGYESREKPGVLAQRELHGEDDHNCRSYLCHAVRAGSSMMFN